MENIEKKFANRRTLVSTFFFSVLAGGAFSKSLELFYGSAFPVFWNSDYFFTKWALFFVFVSILLRFYIGRLLHIKVLEEHPPHESAFAWLFDFSFVLIEFSIIYFMGMCFLNYDAYLFLWLLVTLLVTDCIWIFSMWILGKIDQSYKRGSIPWPWLMINFPCFIFLLLILLFYKVGLHKEIFNSITMMKIIFIVFLVSAVSDIIVTDRHFLLRGKGWKQKSP